MKRVTVISGHYGCGKTNIAVNLALDLKSDHDRVALADIDIVNPYFRSKDSENELAENGIMLICSEYANSNVDIPALPQEIYTVTDDKSLYCILDVGGDERGALALGRLSDAIRQEDDYEMLYVVNCYRPLTADVSSAVDVMIEIENACHLNFTGIINNSNLGEETAKEHVLASLSYAENISKATDLPIVYTAVSDQIFKEFDLLKDCVPNPYPIKLQKKVY